jgi:hypothetical protein
VAVAASRITEPLAGSAEVLDVPRRPMLVAVATAIRKVRISFSPCFADEQSRL